ncbi:Uncharacterised protein [Mycobacteroides abscessus subsp. abscessus]|nr:Uncharacterised protein [Mycobacteroides abscessus subsp. abscessus]
MSKCTGPAFPDLVPRAAARTRQTAERHWLFCVESSSAKPRLMVART